MPNTFTRAMNSQAEVMFKGHNIRKVNQLVEKFGGPAKYWKKMKTWDEWGGEIHFYQHKTWGRVGMKWAGDPDPF